MSSYYLRQHATNRSIRAQVTDATGAVVSLLTATLVTFRMASRATGLVVVDAPGSIADAALGKVRYDFAPADVAEIGRFNGMFLIAFADGSVVEFPTPAYIDIDISPTIESS